MREFGAFEAKNRLGHLLDLVEAGEEVAITRHGREVARLVPARPAFDREQARAADGDGVRKVVDYVEVRP